MSRLDEEFHIEIVSHGWLGSDESEHDLCSHGTIRLTIGGELISHDDTQYGVSEGALALLRTLDNDHAPSRRVAERLVPHGCGTVLMLTCPVGIDWSVTHNEGVVLIRDVARYDTTNEDQVTRFPELEVMLPADHYRREVVAFADEAKRLFDSSPRSFYDEFDREQHEVFWREFSSLLQRHRQQ